MYVKVCFSKKMFTNGLNMGLPLREFVNGVTIYQLSGKEVSGAVVSKGHADNVQRYERTHYYCKFRDRDKLTHTHTHIYY